MHFFVFLGGGWAAGRLRAHPSASVVFEWKPLPVFERLNCVGTFLGRGATGLHRWTDDCWLFVCVGARCVLSRSGSACNEDQITLRAAHAVPGLPCAWRPPRRRKREHHQRARTQRRRVAASTYSDEGPTLVDSRDARLRGTSGCAQLSAADTRCRGSTARITRGIASGPPFPGTDRPPRHSVHHRSHASVRVPRHSRCRCARLAAAWCWPVTTGQRICVQHLCEENAGLASIATPSCGRLPLQQGGDARVGAECQLQDAEL
jgi:hypothetical protein